MKKAALHVGRGDTGQTILAEELLNSHTKLIESPYIVALLS